MGQGPLCAGRCASRGGVVVEWGKAPEVRAELEAGGLNVCRRPSTPGDGSLDTKLPGKEVLVGFLGSFLLHADLHSLAPC